VNVNLGKIDPGNLSTKVEAMLRQALISGAFSPGQRLTIAELAGTLGTSVTPVREALFRLAAIRAIEFSPGRSISVPQLTRERYLELRDIRLPLEGLAAERAAKAIRVDQVEELERFFEEYRLQQDRADYKQVLLFNQKFRFGLYSAAAMPTLLGMIEDLWVQTGPCFNFLYPRLPTDPSYQDEYREALACLKRGDAPGVRHAIEHAILIATKRLLPHLGPSAQAETEQLAESREVGR